MSQKRSDYERLAREALADWPFAVRSHLDGAWLELSCEPVQSVAPGSALLQRNGELAGGVKFVLARTGPAPQVQLRAEVPLDIAPPEARRHIARAHAGFCAALAIDPTPAITASDSAGEAAVDLDARLREVGWPAEVRPDGSLSVDLDVPEEFLAAEIETRAGETRCAVSLAAPESLDTTAWHATAMLLLRAGAVIRLARPVLSQPGGAPRFEVALGGDPSPKELDHALAALAVACRLFAREVDIVQRSPAVATRVLAALGGDTPPVGAAQRRQPPPHIVKPDHNPNQEEEGQWNRHPPQH